MRSQYNLTTRKWDIIFNQREAHEGEFINLICIKSSCTNKGLMINNDSF
jgi:hypothetical protein